MHGPLLHQRGWLYLSELLGRRSQQLPPSWNRLPEIPKEGRVTGQHRAPGRSLLMLALFALSGALIAFALLGLFG